MTDRPVERPAIFGSRTVVRRSNIAEREQNAQTRPGRATNEAGLNRIVDGMRLALRTGGSIHVTRKEIARCAGVTPALVTYYFPQKDDLIEAVTLPIVDKMVGAVEYCLNGAGTAREKLLEAVAVLIASYARDAAIIDLFAAYRASKADKLPDSLVKIEAAFTSFFEDWLKQNGNSVYDAVYLQTAAIGMCKIVARRDQPGTAQNTQCESQRWTPAEAICAMLLSPIAKGESAKISALETGAAASA